MGNSLLTASVIAREMGIQIKNNMKFASTVFRGNEPEWQGNVNGYKKGDTVAVRLPARHLVGTTASMASANDFVQVKRNLTVDQTRNTIVKFTSAELTKSLGEFSKEILEPAAITLANSLDAYVAQQLAAGVAQTYVGTAGTVNSLAHVYGARQYLVNAGMPTDGNARLALCPSHVASLLPVAGTLFNASVTDPILKDAAFGRFGGFSVWESQNYPAHYYGTVDGGTAAANAAITFGTAPTSGTIAQATYAIKGGAMTIQAGDTFTIAGVYGCNPMTSGALAQSTGQLKQFVVATAATVASGTAVNVIVYEGAIGNGPYQNITTATGGTIATVASGAVFTFTGGTGAVTYQQSLAYHRDCFSLAVVPLELPDGATWKGRYTADGISVRMIKDYSILADEDTCRVDILFGGAMIAPGLACKII